MRAGNQSGDIQELDRNATTTVVAAAIVWLALVLYTEARARAFDLQVADCALRVDGREPS